MILAIWTSAGIRYAASQTRSFDVQHFAHMDDRTFFCKKLDGVKAAIDAWATWSREVGLKESLTKTQICGKTKKQLQEISVPI